MGFQRQKKDLFNCMFLLVNCIKIVAFICKQAPEKLKCFFWRRIIIFHKYWLFCLYSWHLHFLWPFVFCLSFISNNLNNVTSPSSNQRFWPDSRLILHHHYGINFFVAESQKFLPTKRLHATARSQEKWLFSEATQSKTSVKYMYLWYAWGKIGGFGIDWYIYPSLK